MAAANSAGEVAVRPGVIEVVMGVRRAGIVPNPFAVVVNVRSLRVAGRIAEVPRFFSGRWVRLTLRLGRTVLRDIMTSRLGRVLFTLPALMLGPSRDQEH
jgi:hypothetical protein